MRYGSVILLLILCVSGISTAQGPNKPWNEWSKKDAEKILNDSAWGQTQSIGGNSEPSSTSAITRTQGGGSESISRVGQSGESLAGPNPLNLRVRFLTAKPVREAFARLVVLSQPNAGKDLVDQLQAFIDRNFGDYLVVAVNAESADQRMANGTMMALSKLDRDALKGKVYLERKDGKRLELVDYRPPIADNMGAKFIFQRTQEGQPFLTESSDFVRFVMELSEKLKVNLKFKVAAMSYSGKLEY